MIIDSEYQNVIYKIINDTRSPEEKDGIEKFFSMMSFLKAQRLLRSRLSNEDNDC